MISAALIHFISPGGPGASSIGNGAFAENGPFRVKADGKTLEVDKYSWNQLANMLYLESPVNVGFSYNSTPLAEVDMYNDAAAIDAKYNALLSFFKKFPQFKKNPFYITGESYGGIYIPLLTRKILDNQRENGINLQGKCCLIWFKNDVQTKKGNSTQALQLEMGSMILTSSVDHALSFPTTTVWWALTGGTSCRVHAVTWTARVPVSSATTRPYSQTTQ